MIYIQSVYFIILQDNYIIEVQYFDYKLLLLC